MTTVKAEYAMPITMHEDEVAHLEETVNALPENAKLIEWGSGGSTTMFLELLKPGQKLISIEHNEEWYNKVTAALENHPKRAQLEYLFIPPDGVDLRFWGYGIPNEENPVFLEEYINPEKAFDDLEIFNADFYLVDGIARGACLSFIYGRLKGSREDVAVYIHDYVGREQWYDWAVDLYGDAEIVGKTLLKLSI